MMSERTSARPRIAPPSLMEAVLPLIAMFLLLVLGVQVLGLEVGSPLLIWAMLGAASVAGVSALRRGHGWSAIQRVTGEKLAAVLPAVLILLSIGLMIGSWVLSGTIPTMVYYGILLIRPDYMVLTAFLATGVMSLCTGTSWGSAGTIGVALMGMGLAMELPLGPTAGAIVSGAYLGDKLSPLSDSTNICAIGAGADLYRHIRNMLYTALPSAFLACLVYALLGTATPTPDDRLPEAAFQLLNELEATYSLHWIVLLPPLLVVTGVLLKQAPALTIVLSSVLALALGVAWQGFSLQQAVAAGIGGFDIGMLERTGFDSVSASSLLRTLLNRGGLFSMSNTLLVIIAAFLLASGMELSGGLDRLVGGLLRGVRSTFGLVAASMSAGALVISLTSHGGVTALLVGGLFQEAYREYEMAAENLSRVLEDSVTIVEPLMPWTVSAIFRATTLGVPTLTYLPWAVFCLGGPIFSLLYGATFQHTGFGLKPLAENGASG